MHILPSTKWSGDTTEISSA
nr:unnamed protein product [Callosobruchus chinensis]